MEQTYLSVARQGRNRLKDYILGTILIFSIAMIVGVVAIFVLAALTPYPANSAVFQKGGIELFIYGHKLRYIIFNGALNIGLALGIFLAVQRVHKRKFLTLIGPDGSISWHRAIEGFIVGLGVWIISFPLFYFINPTRYTFGFNHSEWLPLALLSLAIVPLTSFTASLLLAYLLQGLGIFARKPLFLLIAFALISCLGAQSIDSLIVRILNATFIVWIVLKDNRFELATGLIASGHLISTILISSPSSALKLPTIIRISETNVPLINVASLLLMNSLFYYFCFHLSKNRSTSSSD
jgi:uncharacterized protein